MVFKWHLALNGIEKIHTFNAVPSGLWSWRDYFHGEKCGDVTGSQRAPSLGLGELEEQIHERKTWELLPRGQSENRMRGAGEIEPSWDKHQFSWDDPIKMGFCWGTGLFPCGNLHVGLWGALRALLSHELNPRSSLLPDELQPRWRKEWFQQLDEFFRAGEVINLWSKLSGKQSLLWEASSDSFSAEELLVLETEKFVRLGGPWQTRWQSASTFNVKSENPGMVWVGKDFKAHPPPLHWHVYETQGKISGKYENFFPCFSSSPLWKTHGGDINSNPSPFYSKTTASIPRSGKWIE